MNNKKNSNDGCVLAFDYGLSQIGVAVGETLSGSARPLTILKANDGVPNWEQMARCLAEWQPRYVVIGLPLNMDGSESEMSGRARKFGNRLHGRFGVDVELLDERLTSREARASISDGEQPPGKSTRRARGRRIAHNRVDAVAATIILQSWLATRS